MVTDDLLALAGEVARRHMTGASKALLPIEFLAGTTIDWAFAEACGIADRMGIGVRFRFNGDDYWVWPGDDPHVHYQKWFEARSTYRTPKPAKRG